MNRQNYAEAAAAVRAQPTNHNTLTAKIRNRQSLFRLALRLSNAETTTAIQQRVQDWLIERDRTQFFADDGSDKPLTCRRLGARMLLALRRECVAEPNENTESPADRAPTDCGAELLKGL